ncbi:MAG: hypothetical protein IPI71_09525 [Methanolinea sp.]|nr:MAG: hypothetical protein IPI71_09525 [Methanolinea sp.]
MQKNTTFSLGNIALIDKIDSETNFFASVLGGVGGRSKSFIPSVKLLISNKLNQSVSINKILDFTPTNFSRHWGLKIQFQTGVCIGLWNDWEKESRLFLTSFNAGSPSRASWIKTQFVDFSSSYFEGTKCPLGELGYSRDNQPGKLQIAFGISVGLNNIPTMLTIQKGNVQDKKHMQMLIRLCSSVLPEGSLLVFDCGGNT